MESLHHQCPLCKGEFNPPQDVTPQNHLAKGVIETYRAIQEKSDGSTVPPCPRCGMRMNACLDNNAKSRHEEIFICEKCGEDEALREHRNEILPISEWFAVKEILGIQ
jgi:superfamily II helicase